MEAEKQNNKDNTLWYHHSITIMVPLESNLFCSKIEIHQMKYVISGNIVLSDGNRVEVYVISFFNSTLCKKQNLMNNNNNKYC